jgi:uncharacterized protein YgiM (DUF1202 family)
MRRFTSLLIILVLMLGVGVMSASAQASQAVVYNANALNVRTAPTTSAGIVAAVSNNMSFTVLGRLGDNSWWQIQLMPSGVVGWVSGQFVSVTNSHLVPVMGAPAATPATFSTATVTAYYLNVRAIPNPYSGAIQTTVPRSHNFRVVGKSNGIPTWYQIQLPNGSLGWINGNYALVENANLVPVTYTETTQPTPIPQQPAYGTVYNVYFLNVRSTPNPYIQNVLTVIARNQTYQVLGKNSAGTWYQINVNGIIGWVNGNYLSVTNAHTVPVTF